MNPRRERWPGRGAATSALVALVALGCLQSEGVDAAAASMRVPEVAGDLASAGGWSDADWTAFSSRVRAGLAQRWDTLRLGANVAAVGRTFVGTP